MATNDARTNDARTNDTRQAGSRDAQAARQLASGAVPFGPEAPLRLSRLLHAPRATVFLAWSSAEHVKRWFSPQTYTVPHADVRMQVGGPFDLCMRSEAGVEHWVRGTFTAVTPDTAFAIDMRVTDASGLPLFRALLQVELVDALGGTRLEMTQTYELIDLSKAGMLAAAPEGWRSTLDKLEREALRLQGAGAPDSGAQQAEGGVVHDSFDLERTYDAPVTRVWQALTDETAKQKWFGGSPGSWTVIERHMDVRVGGREFLKGRWEGGVVSTFDALYHDVVPNQRLVYSYQLFLDEKKISVSLATLQLATQGRKTTLKVTEQGAFLDGYQDAGSRQRGTGLLLDALGASLHD